MESHIWAVFLGIRGAELCVLTQLQWDTRQQFLVFISFYFPNLVVFFKKKPKQNEEKTNKNSKAHDTGLKYTRNGFFSGLE